VQRLSALQPIGHEIYNMVLMVFRRGFPVSGLITF
jgi:hypothetical protein